MGKLATSNNKDYKKAQSAQYDTFGIVKHPNVAKSSWTAKQYDATHQTKTPSKVNTSKWNKPKPAPTSSSSSSSTSKWNKPKSAPATKTNNNASKWNDPKPKPPPPPQNTYNNNNNDDYKSNVASGGGT